MALRIATSRAEHLKGFFSRKIVLRVECWYCENEPRPASLTCHLHKRIENNAELALRSVLENISIDAEKLPVCFSCHAPYFPNTSPINVCDSCLLQAVVVDDEIT